MSHGFKLILRLNAKTLFEMLINQILYNRKSINSNIYNRSIIYKYILIIKKKKNVKMSAKIHSEQ